MKIKMWLLLAAYAAAFGAVGILGARGDEDAQGTAGNSPTGEFASMEPTAATSGDHTLMNGGEDSAGADGDGQVPVIASSD